MTEFFELFKTPWRFYRQGECYDIVIVDQAVEELPEGKIIFLYGAETLSFDSRNNLNPVRKNGLHLLKKRNGRRFPVFQGTCLFGDPLPNPLGSAFLESEDDHLPASFCLQINGKTVIRIGYDLFSEVHFLLSKGQPPEYAHISTLDIHISIIRKLILRSGGFLIEIPPVPFGHSFITCLTHDVDFIELKPHKLDRSVLGFIARGLNPIKARGFDSKIAWKNVLRNWLAILTLPGVYLGRKKDPWFDIDRYLILESDTHSTFYFIPLKNVSGSSGRLPEPKYRAARYDISNYAELMQCLCREGFEVGVHGIDAWHDSEKGENERKAIFQAVEQNHIGIRMHWLHFADESPDALKQAQYLYDSTRGYNDAIGFCCGTAQVFQFSNALPELPLVIMDTALFYPDRMGLPWNSALRKCKEIISNMRRYGGALTINWHTRSLMPERNWGDFYMALLGAIKCEKTIFMTACQAVSWFAKRRQALFEDIQFSDNHVKIWLRSKSHFDDPSIFIRIYLPIINPSSPDGILHTEHAVMDIPITDNKPICVPLSEILPATNNN
ncbi:MAG: hypothetical protein HY881_11385 [Deltaproteobacteria bacterium]|nr:hypothetical protein [Deltaproteobacteria bacterium]